MSQQEIPADLSDKVKTIRLFANTHNVIVRGSYRPEDFQLVHDCALFIRQAHEEALRQAAQHESADLVPELKEFKERQAETK